MAPGKPGCQPIRILWNKKRRKDMKTFKEAIEKLKADIGLTSKKNKLSTREWELYKLLKRKAVGKQNQIKGIDIINEHIGYTCTPDIRKSIAKMKNSSIIQRIICATNNGYYLAQTEEEAIQYLEADRKRYKKGLKANYNQVKKLRLNGQGRITFGKYEKEYIQSISDDLGGENEE